MSVSYDETGCCPQQRTAPARLVGSVLRAGAARALIKPPEFNRGSHGLIGDAMIGSQKKITGLARIAAPQQTPGTDINAAAIDK